MRLEKVLFLPAPIDFFASVAQPSPVLNRCSHSMHLRDIPGTVTLITPFIESKSLCFDAQPGKAAVPKRAHGAKATKCNRVILGKHATCWGSLNLI